MYHSCDKKSSYLRDALYKVHKGQCIYCGTKIEPRSMHVDHILPTNRPITKDNDILNYINELDKKGFIQDSIENYVPTCPACNIKKSNMFFNASNLRFYHEMANRHVDKILEIIEAGKKHKEIFYEPVDSSVWEEVDFSYQRNITYAIMGYRLTSHDVEACPVFPQVDKTEKQLAIVDYVMIQGETGCGKSISLFQVANKFHKRGWRVYLLRNSYETPKIMLPDNSENSLYLIDDAQIHLDYMIEHLEEQSRPNRKILIAKTVTEAFNMESIVLTNKDSVNVLFNDFSKRKNEIWPIVKRIDNSIGVNMHDTPIEYRLNDARNATTPWQFSYILRGGWKTMKDLYSSICNHNNCDLLAAAIAVFQVLTLDKNVDYYHLCHMLKQMNPEYNWTKDDLQYLITKKIVLSEDDIRIVHMESAHVIINLFFDCKKTEKQAALLRVIDNEFLNSNISPLGIVWLCNGCRRYLRYYCSAEDIFLSDAIVTGLKERMCNMETSEEIRNTLYLLEKIVGEDYYRNDNRGLLLFNKYKRILLELIYSVDSVSAWGYAELLNTIYNKNPKAYYSFAKKVKWELLMESFLKESSPNYYSWGRFFNRGLSLTGEAFYSKYSEKMSFLLDETLKRATQANIDKITSFVCDVVFLNYEQIHEKIPVLIPVFKEYFENNMEKAIHIFGFEFNEYICGINVWGKQKPSVGQKSTARLLLDVIPNDKLAWIISNSSMHEWLAIRDILHFILVYDLEKYKDIIKIINLERLSISVRESWNKSHEICLVIDALCDADISIARTFLQMNAESIECFYSIMIIVDTDLAITKYRERGIPLELFTAHWWDYSLAALKKLAKTDIVFTRQYLYESAQQIAERYSDVRGLDFTERYALDILILIKRISNESFAKISSIIDKEKILKEWDNCGYDNRKKQWVAKRKEEFLSLIS